MIDSLFLSEKRYNGNETGEQTNMTSMMNAIKNESANSNLTRTENGALGFSNHVSPIVDFFYKVSTMRQCDAEAKRSAFSKALAEDKDLAYRMLFFVRDVRGGLGERKTFRDIFRSLPGNVIKALFEIVPEYGRWDDLICLLNDGAIEGSLKDEICDFLHGTLISDIENMREGRPITLLAKWMPSIRGVSKNAMRTARMLADKFDYDERTYRKTLSSLREYLKVVEKKMSGRQWGEINYSEVPSKAAMRYRSAFVKHDGARYSKYVSDIASGKAKVNASAVFPYEIVHELRRCGGKSDDTWSKVQLLEEQWKALPLPKDGLLSNAIVVRDGSGSMTSYIPGTQVEISDVATALSVLTSENLKGEFKDKFITFSGRPKFVDLSGCSSLREKLNVCYNEYECANTNIVATMRLILNAAVKNGIRQEEIPAVVIISDMEFDDATGHYNEDGFEETLFATIKKEWNNEGYQLPKIAFWNVGSRTGAVPMQENGNGLILISGFSQNLLDMLSYGGTPFDIIAKRLRDKRYDMVSEAIRKIS